MKYLKYLFIVIMTVFLDQISKKMIVANFDLYESIDIIPGFMQFKYVQNTGAGFSILEGQMTFFYIITIVALVFIAYLFYKSSENVKLERFALALMFGGALGNFIDRLLLGYVVDFIAVDIFGYPFPVFNLADTFLCVGVFFFILVYLMEVKNGSN